MSALKDSLNAARLGALAGQNAASHWCKNLEGDFSNIVMHLDAALRSLETQQSAIAPSGWMLVPIEPTEEMLNSGAKFSLSLRDAYVDMLRAVPTAPSEPVAWLKSKGDRRRVDLFPDLDSWMTHDKGWSVTPLYATPQTPLMEELPTQETLMEWRGTLKDIACHHDKCEEIEAFFSRFIK